METVNSILNDLDEHWYKPQDYVANRERKHKNSPKYNRQRLYGISVGQYDQMVNNQKGLCAICNNPETKRKLSVDHDHKTGVIRGLLCTKCNLGLGYFKDDPTQLMKAAEYLNMASIKSGQQSNDTFSTLPTKATNDKTEGSLKISLPSPSKKGK